MTDRPSSTTNDMKRLLIAQYSFVQKIHGQRDASDNTVNNPLFRVIPLTNLTDMHFAPQSEMESAPSVSCSSSSFCDISLITPTTALPNTFWFLISIL